MKKVFFMLRDMGIPIAVSAVGILLMAFIGMSLQNEAIPLWKVSANHELNFTFTIQVMALGISFVALWLMYLYDPENFRTFFRFKTGQSKIGNEAASKSGECKTGKTGFSNTTSIEDNESGSIEGNDSSSTEDHHWKFYGPLAAAGFTLGTMMYMSVSVSAQHGQVNASFYKLIPLVLLFAATNAWTEEILSRFVIVAGLHGKLPPNTICWISAVIFGLGHIFGTPNGVFGVFASGFLGWVLAKSVIDTKGMGWAWFIHFLQDVVIFGAGAMVLAAQKVCS